MGCASTDEFAVQLEALIRPGMRSQGGFTFKVSGRRAQSWVLEITERDRPMRELVGDSCQELVEAALLMV